MSAARKGSEFDRAPRVEQCHCHALFSKRCSTTYKTFVNGLTNLANIHNNIATDHDFGENSSFVSGYSIWHTAKHRYDSRWVSFDTNRREIKCVCARMEDGVVITHLYIRSERFNCGCFFV